MLPIEPTLNPTNGLASVDPASKREPGNKSQEQPEDFQDVFDDGNWPPTQIEPEFGLPALPKTYAPGLPGALLPSSQISDQDMPDLVESNPVEGRDSMDFTDVAEDTSVEGVQIDASFEGPQIDASFEGPQIDASFEGAQIDASDADRFRQATVPVQTEGPKAEMALENRNAVPQLSASAALSEAPESRRRATSSDPLLEGPAKKVPVSDGFEKPQLAQAEITKTKDVAVSAAVQPSEGSNVAEQRPAMPTTATAPPAVQVEPVLRSTQGRKVDVDRIPDVPTPLTNRLPMLSATTNAPAQAVPMVTTAFTPFADQPIMTAGVDVVTPTGGEVVSKEAGLLVGQDLTHRLATTAMPVQPAQPQTAQSTSVSQQIAMQISLQVGNARSGEVELRLEPEELGKLRITILPREMGVTLSIVAERPETLELLRRNSDQLLADLGGMDLGDASLEFSGGERERSSQDGPTLSDVMEEQATSVVVTSAGLAPGRLDIRL